MAYRLKWEWTSVELHIWRSDPILHDDYLEYPTWWIKLWLPEHLYYHDIEVHTEYQNFTGGSLDTLIKKTIKNIKAIERRSKAIERRLKD